MRRLFSRYTGLAKVLTAILGFCLVMGILSAYPTIYEPPVDTVKAFMVMPKVAKSEVKNRPKPKYRSSSGNYSSRGSGSYSYRRSYRGGGYSYGK